MGLRAIKIAGADDYATNQNNAKTHWLDTVQVSTRASHLYKISYTALADVWLWVFDKASAPTGADVPVMARPCPAGYADTWDFASAGSVFKFGIYIALSSAAPVTPASTPTASGDDKALVKVEFRNE